MRGSQRIHGRGAAVGRCVVDQTDGQTVDRVVQRQQRTDQIRQAAGFVAHRRQHQHLWQKVAAVTRVIAFFGTAAGQIERGNGQEDQPPDVEDQQHSRHSQRQQR